MRITLVLMATLGLLAAACSQDRPAAATDAAQPFSVNSVEVKVIGEGPAQVTIAVHGHFLAACLTVAEVRQNRADSSVSVDIGVARSSDAPCEEGVFPHTETIELGTFEEPGTYTLRVNDFSTSFTIGTAGVDELPYEAPLVVPLETPDGAINLMAPLGWAVEVNQGILRVADDANTLYASSPVISGPSLTLIVATGPSRARDFGLDGRTLNEVYAYFIATTGVRPGPPRPATALPFPGLQGQQRDPYVGDAELRVLSLNEATSVVIIASCPPGEWSKFSPLVEAMVASLRVR